MSNVANYELRSRVLQLDDTERIYQTYKLYRRVEYCRLYNLPPPVEYHPEVHLLEFDYLQSFYPSEWSECEKIYKADKSRHLRLKYKMRYMFLLARCYFVRFSFTDQVLASTNSYTRRQYVSRWLRDLNCAYICNIDFGELHGREHYHAVVAARPTESQLLDWINSYGTMHVKPVRGSFASSVRLSKYVSKLCNHAVKSTCKRGSLLYSRLYKLPSSRSEFLSFVEKQVPVAPILAKGYVLRIDSIQDTHISHSQKFRVLRVSKSDVPVLFNRFCSMCGSFIVDYSSNVQNYVYTKPLANGKTKKLYFCSECIKKYNIKTGG